MSQVVLLKPRPYALTSGALLLVPLLPTPPAQTKLPSELWYSVFKFLRSDGPGTILSPVLRVSKLFKEIALPLFYSHVVLNNVCDFLSLSSQIHYADSRWDSLRKNQYSTPGRWIHVLDLSQLTYTTQSDALLLDSTLTNLFPLMPCLSSLIMNPAFPLSRRALKALAQSDSVASLRVLQGIFHHSSMTDDDALLEVLKRTHMLQELNIVGPGTQSTDHDLSQFIADVCISQPFSPLHLPHLHTISMLAMPLSSSMHALLLSPLPSLRKLTITPYDDIPYPLSLTSQFIATHGSMLRSLYLLSPNSWPSRRHPSPENLLETCPNLYHLSLEKPIPQLRASSKSHPLRTLSIPRPTIEAGVILDGLFPCLPSLSTVRVRDVRWLRMGLTSRAQEAGVQGEMREWARRLLKRRIRILDADWKLSS